jgi:uncharacterized membrane-anchored protein
LGDILTKTHAQGGLDLGTIGSSIVLGIFLVGCILASARNHSRGRARQVADGDALRV